MSVRAAPVGGPVATGPLRVLAAVAGLGGILLAWRFVAGLGATTALSDGYPWGLWIAWDVVVGTGLATGGYAMAILVYALNRGRYHPLVRSALVTSALGYTFAGLSVVIDLGRWWNVWKLSLFAPSWNLHSVLLEVALCIMLYTLVLWLELAPVFLERMSVARSDFLRELSDYCTPKLEKALPFVIALGILLPTMHQSSLGALLLIAGDKVNPLWQTPLLPLLFLLSCLAMGYGAVVIESQLASAAFGRPSELRLLRGLRVPMAALLAGYAAIRVADLAARGRIGLVLALDGYSALFLLEMALFLAPAAMLWWGRPGAARLFRASLLIVLAGGLYRFSTFLIAFRPGEGWSYFPAVAELLITFGIIAAEVALYLVIVKKLPILAALPPKRYVHLPAGAVDRLAAREIAPTSVG